MANESARSARKEGAAARGMLDGGNGAGDAQRATRLQKIARNVDALVMATNRLISSRHDIANRAGQAFAGERDYYTVLGWKRDLQFDDYYDKWERQDIAGRVVDFPAEETWRSAPSLQDGEGNETADDTDFVTVFNDMAKRLRLWNKIERADKLAGIGRFGVLLIGYRGDRGLETEIEIPAEAAGGAEGDPDRVIYLRPFAEGSVTIESVEQDPGNPRFGRPSLYTLDLGEAMGEQKQLLENPQQKVHHSRLIHIPSDNIGENDALGTPRLKRPYNLLDDLYKTVGGSAEAAWRMAYKGLIATTKEGFGLPDDFDEVEEIETEMEALVHDIRRILLLEGYDVEELGGEISDPTGVFDVQMALLAGTTQIPKRILLGSERGDLASSQDAANWAGVIKRRRTKYAEPLILSPLVDAWIALGVLPAPRNNSYSWKWDPLFELNQMERSEVAERYANAFNTVTGGFPQDIIGPAEFRETFAELPGERPDGDRPEDLLDEEDEMIGPMDGIPAGVAPADMPDGGNGIPREIQQAFARLNRLIRIYEQKIEESENGTDE